METCETRAVMIPINYAESSSSDGGGGGEGLFPFLLSVAGLGGKMGKAKKRGGGVLQGAE